MIPRRRIDNFTTPDYADKVVNLDNPKKGYRANSTSFKPGQVPNPGGIARPPKEFNQLMRDFSIEAAHQIRQWVHCKDPKISLQASMYIIDRAYGRPTQATELSGPGGSSLTPAPLVVNFVAVDLSTTINGQAEEV